MLRSDAPATGDRRSAISAVRWATRALIALLVVGVALWVHLAEFNGATLWDSAVFLAVSRLLQRGLVLYRDVWDNKPPGIYFYQTAVFALLPTAVWSLRFTDFALYLLGAAALYALCRRVAQRPLALAATCGWLFIAHHPFFNIAGFYTEEYVAIFAAGAVALAARWAAGEGGGWQPCACGFAAGLALLFKTPGLACVAPAVLLLAARRPLRSLPGFGLGAALPLVAVVAYFWGVEALPDLLDSQLRYPIASHELGALDHNVGQRLAQLGVETTRLLGPLPWLIFPALVGASLALAEPSRLRLAALLWAVGDLAMVMAQKFYHAHYFIQAFPALAWLGAIGLAAVLESRPHDTWRRSAWRLALTSGLVVLAWRDATDIVRQRQALVARNWQALRAGPTAWRRGPGGPFEERLGAWVAARSAPDDTIFIHDTGSSSAVYWTADRLPASRYMAENVVRGARLAEQLGELERARPSWVLVAGGPGPRVITPWLQRDYVPVGTRQEAYRVELWGRVRPVPLALGSAAPEGWLSPLVEVNDDDATVQVACEGEPAESIQLEVRSADNAAAVADAAWTPRPAGETPAQAYLQIRCAVAPGAALRAARVGRLRFSADAAPPDTAPLRTS